MSFKTRTVNGAVEIVSADGEWSFATGDELEMLARIAELEAFVRECATISENVTPQEAWRMISAVRKNAKSVLQKSET